MFSINYDCTERDRKKLTYRTLEDLIVLLKAAFSEKLFTLCFQTISRHTVIPGFVADILLFTRCFSSSGPHILSVVNSSLSSGCVPDYFQHGITQPLLKKPSLDPLLPSNCRPISKLPYISKVLEKVACKQLVQVLDSNQNFNRFQSGFRSKHSTETALLGVSNHILMGADAEECSVLLLLDPSAAFDTVDHSILLRLQQWASITDCPWLVYLLFVRQEFFCGNWSLCLLIYVADKWCTPGLHPWSYLFLPVHASPWLLS